MLLTLYIVERTYVRNLYLDYKFLQISLSALTKKTKVMKLQESELEKVTTLLITLQCKLQSLGVDKSKKSRNRVAAGDKLSIEGSTKLAIHSWIHLLETNQGQNDLPKFGQIREHMKLTLDYR